MKQFFVACLLLWGLGLYAQNGPRLSRLITVPAENMSFAQVVSEIKSQGNITIYYQHGALDTLHLHRQGQQSIEGILKSMLDSTDFYYAYDGKGRAYITRGAPLNLIAGGPPVQFQKHVLSRTVDRPAHRSIIGTSKPAEATMAVVTDLEANKVFEIGTGSRGGAKATLTGYIKNVKTGEGIGNVSVIADSSTTGVVTDPYGYYVITLTKGRHVLRMSCVGMADTRRRVVLKGDGRLSVSMFEYVTSLKGVTISGEKSSNVRSTTMGAQKLDIVAIKQVPALMGEADVLRALQMLPGVTSAGEGSTGLNVRGGNVDQNLVQLDGATIYNPSHFFGFFSGFNPDLIKNAELYKSSIPVKYGGRLSSVLEVLTREGNSNKFSGSGGISPLNGHLTLEGPLGGRTSLLVGGRSTYSDWLLKLLPDDQYKHSSARFFDGNLKITSELDDHNSVYVSGYLSGDKFRLEGDTSYHYGNQNGVIKWKHVFNSRLYGNFTAGIDGYNFDMSSVSNKINAFKFKFDIAQYHFNTDFVLSMNNRNKIEMGLSSLYYKLHPGSYTPLDSGLAIPNILPSEHALESALYVSDQFTVSPRLTIEGGIRYSIFNAFGPSTKFDYLPGVSRDVSTITDTVNYSTGKLFKTYHGPEPRISARYSLSANLSIKAAYNRTQQYIHMLSNTTVVSPTDIWKLSDNYIRPEIGDQVSLGIYRNFKSNVIETSIELYYKRIGHAISYKSGATLILNRHIETDIANADGKAYGLEFLVKKTAGKLNGWFSYTYSRILLRMNDPLVSEPINNGKYYPADYDKPHVANFVGNYRFSHRFSVSLTSVYTTGRPITLPVVKYYLAGSERVYYEDRNQSRIPDYFRTDLSMNIEGNHKVNKLGTSSWTIGAYNLLGRRNAYSVYFVSENGKVNGYKLSIFGSAIPFVTYNFKF